jgi:NAD-dependent SIR2 family protein deacetylase
MKIKNVIILGAGASKSEGAPLQKELIGEFFKLLKEGKLSDKLEENNGDKNNYYNQVKDYFEKFWGINIENIEKINNDMFPTFEECLGVLDLAYLRGECFKECSKNNIIEYRNALIFCIAKTLEITLKKSSKKGYHKKLVNKLRDEGILKETAFISLNYDILIDNALVDIYRRNRDLYLDYGIPFINYELPKKDKYYWEKPKEGKSILLLKLHGSLNWLYCPTCNSMKLTPKEKGGIKAFETEECEKCGTKMEPVIIPPTFYKDMSNPFIQQIYLKADEVLRNAEKIFICGYSFPDADMHIKYLLKRAEMFKGNTPKIFVINKKPKKDNEMDDKMKRIMRFFKNKNNIEYKELSFEGFAEEILTLIGENKNNLHKNQS